MNSESEVISNTLPNEFLDTVEDDIVSMNNKRLSAVFQCLDFELGLVTIKPMTGVALTKIVETLPAATAERSYVIPMQNMISCYNLNLLFNSTDLNMLEKALMHEERYAIHLGDRKFAIMRGFRG